MSKLASVLFIALLASPTLASAKVTRAVPVPAQTRLPSGAAHTRDYGTGFRAITVPSYHPTNAPQTINVGTREYRLNNVAITHVGLGPQQLRYSETMSSMQKNESLALQRRLTTLRNASW